MNPEQKNLKEIRPSQSPIEQNKDLLNLITEKYQLKETEEEKTIFRRMAQRLSRKLFRKSYSNRRNSKNIKIFTKLWKLHRSKS